MILGTAAYMAPEQAKGRPVDRRADVWAFGVVFFEMLAGRRAFDGDDVSDVLASVLKMEPEWNALPADLPGPVRRLLRRCLEKDPKKRLRDVGEGMLQLEEGLASGSTSSIVMEAFGDATAMSAPPAPRPLWRGALPILATAGLTAAALIAMNAWSTVPPEPPMPVRFIHEPPEKNPIGLSTNYRELAFAPDGKTIVYAAADSSGRADLWGRRLDQVDAVPIRGGEAAANPFVSPDSQWIGFIDSADGVSVKKVSILGGPPVPVVRLAGVMAGAVWTRDGSIIFGARSQPLMIVKESGGEPVPLTTLDSDAGDVEHLWPAEVPGTSVILFVTGYGTSPALGGQLAAFDRATGRLVRFKLTGVQPKYLKTGHVVYATGDGSLRAVAFNPQTMEMSANPVPVLEGLGVKVSGAANFDVADDGRLAYIAGGDQLNANRTITWTNRAGKETPIPADPRNYYYARIAPDGSRLSLDIRDQEQDIWIWDLRRETLSRLTVRSGADQYGLWTPKSDRVVFNSAGGGKSELFQMRADGTGQVEPVSDTSKEKLSPFPNAITPDGNQVIFRAASSASRNDLWIVSLRGDRSVKPLLAKEHNETNATLSPDGKWMAYESDLTNRYEVYVRPFPDVDAGQFPVSTAGGTEPLWSQKSAEIFYVSADNKMMSVRVSTTKGFVAEKPTMLFDTKTYYFGGQGRNYDVTADGQRFVMVKEPVSLTRRSLPITVVLNWAEELRAKLK
jgi:eukaryotic-like serine/threonine-protein kinase